MATAIPTTTCRRGHDQTVPNARGINPTTGGSFCRACRREDAKRRNRDRGARDRACAVCGQQCRSAKPYCSNACMRALARNGGTSRDLTLPILRLGLQLETCMPWEREALKQQLEQLKRK